MSSCARSSASRRIYKPGTSCPFAGRGDPSPTHNKSTAHARSAHHLPQGRQASCRRRIMTAKRSHHSAAGGRPSPTRDTEPTAHARSAHHLPPRAASIMPKAHHDREALAHSAVRRHPPRPPSPPPAVPRARLPGRSAAQLRPFTAMNSSFITLRSSFRRQATPASPPFPASGSSAGEAVRSSCCPASSLHRHELIVHNSSFITPPSGAKRGG